MDKSLKVFVVTPEVYPFTRANELGEAAGALPKALKDLGHDVRVMMPNYKRINARKYILRDVIRLKDMKIDLGGEEVLVSAKSAFLPDSKVQIYFLDNRDFFGRNGLYSDPDSGKEYDDNAERFIVFCKGCIETLRMLHWQPDILLCNSWQSALVGLQAKTIFAKDQLFANTKFVFSLHPPFRLPRFSPAQFAKTGLPKEVMEARSCFDKDGHFDITRAALEFSDLVIAGNEQQAQKMCAQPDSFNGLTEAIRENKGKIVGLEAGFDHSIWSPGSDKLISQTFDPETIADKEINKKALLEKLSMPYAKSTPVVGMILPAENGETTKKLKALLKQLIDLGVQVVLFGQDAGTEQAQIGELQKKYHKQLAYKPKSDPELQHLLMAGADMYFHFSSREPQGVTHLISLKYGTIPILASASGVNPKIKNYYDSPGTATGFVVTTDDQAAVLDAIKDAIALYEDSRSWKKLIENAMRQDFSWHAIGPRYVKHFADLLK